MINPTLDERIVVIMLLTFAQFGIEDTLENRLEFLETTLEKLYKDPVIGSPKYVEQHIAIAYVIADLKVELALQEKQNS